MSRHKAVVLAAATMLFVLGSAGPAFAAGETVGTCIVEELNHVGIEHFEELEHAVAEGTATDAEKDELVSIEEDLEDCVEAPNPIIPEVTEIIWGGLAFAVLFGLMSWKLFPAVKDNMDARSDKIRDDLAAADKARADAEAERARYEAELGDAKAEASRIIDEARQQAATVRSDLQARAEAEIVEMRRQAAADVDVSKAQAMDELRGEVGDIALGAAEMVIGSTLDRAAHESLIEDYIARVGSRN